MENSGASHEAAAPAAADDDDVADDVVSGEEGDGAVEVFREGEGVAEAAGAAGAPVSPAVVELRRVVSRAGSRLEEALSSCTV